MSTGAPDSLAEDEKRLWVESREKSRRLDQSGVLHRSLELHDYVNTVAQRVIPPSLRGREIVVKVIQNPYFNAVSYPHGAIYIHSGLLAAMENEAQLAALLGHEIAHFSQRHALAAVRSAENVSVSLQILSMASSRAGYYGLLAPWFNLFAINAAVSGYSQAKEWEADTLGLDLAVQAGYDPRESPKLFDHLERELKDRDKDQPFFFGSHPRVAERRDNYQKLVESIYAGRSGEIGSERFNEKLASTKLENAEMNIAQGRWDWAKSALEQFLSLHGHNPRGHYLLGELYRLRNQTGDSERAELAFEAAVKREETFPLAHRGLGLLYSKKGDFDKAQLALRRYLELAPNASDRGHIESQLVALETGKAP